MRQTVISIIVSIVVSVFVVYAFYNWLPIGGIEPIQKESELLGASITTIAASDTLKDSRSTINTNFSNLNDGKIEVDTTTVESILRIPNIIEFGISSSTPWGALSIEQNTATSSFIVANQGSTTPAFIVMDASSTSKVGIATSTPSATFAVGDGSATTTIDFGKVCFRVQTDTDTTLYWWFTNNPIESEHPIATSTTSCF